ncbi:MAG: NTP transferase domain-containing protein [Candidatus Lokiarchaeota archaeon]|nr:NTP transferase domain-containing protein [Candidatus Lokiarchaeota archaeon]
MTKGLILSGGWGTRLRPLTCTIPKTLIPVGNKPVIERQMELLKSAGVKEIVLAVSVMSEFLKNYFGDGKRLGIKIHYTNEQSPMGTAGALKLAEPFLKDDNFFMLNGDVILNFNFKEMLRYHEEFNGIGTIASRQVEDPSRYGVLIINEESQKILQFLEKDEFDPDKHGEGSMPVNAGVYILEPEVFSHIEPHRKLSIERDIFPKLAAAKDLHHYPITGIWKDIGKPYELLNGNILLMKDILEKSPNSENIIEKNADIHDSVKIFPPVSIGENTVIRQDCSIGPDAVIGNNVYIEKGCSISDSLIYDEVYISKNVKIKNAIIADNCLIRKNVKLEGNQENLVILADHVQVNEGVKIIGPKDRSITVCHHEVVKEHIE